MRALASILKIVSPTDCVVCEMVRDVAHGTSRTEWAILVAYIAGRRGSLDVCDGHFAMTLRAEESVARVKKEGRS